MALNTAMNEQACSTAPIIIEENVWLGANVIVLKGVNIAKGAVVGAGSVVTKSIGENEIWAGIPAKKIRNRQ
jgi:acetyltransferase-like isoleucine patch superfamily enzyme